MLSRIHANAYLPFLIEQALIKLLSLFMKVVVNVQFCLDRRQIVLSYEIVNLYIMFNNPFGYIPILKRLPFAKDQTKIIIILLILDMIDWLILFGKTTIWYNLQYKNMALIDKQLNSYTDYTIQLKWYVVNTRITHKSRKTTYFQWGP